MTPADAAEEAKRVFPIFNEKATKLNGSKFLAAVRSGKHTYSMHWKKGEGGTIVPHLPEDEEIEAYVLTLRLFVQDRDGFSFRCLNRLYADLPINEDLRAKALKMIADLNRFLDAQSPIIIDNRQLGRREIFDVFLYGGLAHSNPHKKPIYDYWTADPLKQILVLSEFVTTVANVTQFIFWLRHVNLDALVELDLMSRKDAAHAV